MAWRNAGSLSAIRCTGGGHVHLPHAVGGENTREIPTVPLLSPVQGLMRSQVSGPLERRMRFKTGPKPTYSVLK